MTQGPAHLAAAHSKWLLFTFLAAFALCILSFVASSLVLRSEAREIGSAATSIANNAGPSIQLLTSMRTSLRHREVALDDFVDLAAEGKGDPAAGAPRHEPGEREAMMAAWGEYAALPTYPGERDLQPAVVSLLDDLNRSVARVLAVERTAPLEAQTIMNEESKPAFDRLDEGLRSLVALNAGASQEEARLIGLAHRRVRVLAVVFDVACALLSLLAGYLAFRVAREHSRLVASQISELELFATRLAHDVRSPLASVKLALDIAVRGGKYPERIPAMLSRASRTLRRVGDLVDGLLMLASISAVRDGHESANLRAVLADLKEEFLPAALDKGVELEIPDAPECWVACSSGVLGNIVSNLAGNAIKYMEDSDVRRVSIRAGESKAVVRIVIEDTGPGIPAYFRQMAFEPFARAAPSGVFGLGLGLATVQRLTLALGGAVGFESQQGKGSTFWVELPKARPPGAEQASGIPSR